MKKKYPDNRGFALIRRPWFYAAGIILIIAVCPGFSGCGRSQADNVSSRPDLVTIDVMEKYGVLNRPAVIFPHDLHTQSLGERDITCDECHLQTPSGYLSTKYKRLEDEDYQAVMDIYHDNCITCHKASADSGYKAGPILCGDCHKWEAPYESSRQPIGFDYSLHYRHVLANDEKCELCHHVYDAEQKELYYAKGQESSCRDCHREVSTEEAISFQEAAHLSCIGCHRREGRGFYTCAGCHSKDSQATIVRIKKPERIERGQPDFMLITASPAEMARSKMNAVPFAHGSHENFTTTCRDCHHETLRACRDCHTLAGDTTLGGGVTRQRAMHAMDSKYSCVGCHDVQKFSADCSGCHLLMEQGRLSEHACEICHAGPEPSKAAVADTRGMSLDDFRPSASEVRLSFAEADIPETVEIGILSEEYKPAIMPHRKIVNALLKDINRNRIARHFHGHEDVVCQGCHHNTPAGKKPPLCENCHGKPFDPSNLHIPGLYGAYHRQCIECHENMQLDLGTDCELCHERKR